MSTSTKENTAPLNSGYTWAYRHGKRGTPADQFAKLIEGLAPRLLEEVKAGYATGRAQRELE